MGRLTGKICGTYYIQECEDRRCEDVCADFRYTDCDYCPIKKAMDKLGEYEDLEEQGKLLRLPVTVDLIERENTIINIWSLFNSIYNDANRFDKDDTKLAHRILCDVQKMIEEQPKFEPH